MALPAAGTAFWSAAAAFCGSDSSRDSVLERCRSVLWLWQQQGQRFGALAVAARTAKWDDQNVKGMLTL